MMKNKIVNTFLELVQISSPTFHEEKMANEIVLRLTKMGLRPIVDKEGNVIVFVAGNKNKETYLLNAHLDTVEDQNGEVIVPKIDKNGWIVSGGTTILGADNKTAVAAILETIERLVGKKSGDSHPLEVVFTVSEESGNHGAHGLDYDSLNAKRGFCFDAGGRKFGDMIIASPFYNRIDIKLLGKSAHAAHPELAINVLPIFAKAILNLRLGKISENTTTNIGVVAAGRVEGPVNTIPGELIVSGEVRSMDMIELENVTLEIKNCFESECMKAGVKVEFKKTRENDGFEFDQNDPFILNTLKQLGNLGIVKPDLARSWGCYEANIFAAHGIMMLNIADGSLDNHTKTERIKVSDLERLEKLVYELVTN